MHIFILVHKQLIMVSCSRRKVLYLGRSCRVGGQKGGQVVQAWNLLQSTWKRQVVFWHILATLILSLTIFNLFSISVGQGNVDFRMGWHAYELFFSLDGFKVGEALGSSCCSICHSISPDTRFEFQLISLGLAQTSIFLVSWFHMEWFVSV